MLSSHCIENSGAMNRPDPSKVFVAWNDGEK